MILNPRSIVTWRESDFAELPALRMIATCSVGTDAIDLDAAKARGIVVSNQPGVNAPFVAEHMFGLMFAVAKQAAVQTAALKAGQWRLPINATLQGKRLGIVGTGAIGAEMARLGQAMGMEVVAWTFNPTLDRARALGVTFITLDELLQTSDVVSLHVRLSDASRGLIGAPEIAQLKPTAILLNGARGDVVDNDALATALADHRLFGAGVDVFPEEPVGRDNPLLACERVVLTPHCADQTPEAVVAVNRTAVDNILAFLEGFASGECRRVSLSPQWRLSRGIYPLANTRAGATTSKGWQGCCRVELKETAERLRRGAATKRRSADWRRFDE